MVAVAAALLVRVGLRLRVPDRLGLAVGVVERLAEAVRRWVGEAVWEAEMVQARVEVGLATATVMCAHECEPGREEQKGPGCQRGG